MSPLTEALDGYAELAQTRWAAWRRKHRLDDRLPALFADLLATVLDFADPAITGSAAGLHWNPVDRGWIRSTRNRPERPNR